MNRDDNPLDERWIEWVSRTYPGIGSMPEDQRFQLECAFFAGVAGTLEALASGVDAAAVMEAAQAHLDRCRAKLAEMERNNKH